MGLMRCIPAVVVCGLLAGACGGETTQDPGGSGRIVVDTLESGRIVVKTPDSALWPAGGGCELQESFRLGAAEGDGPDVFFGPVQVELGAAGELFVFDMKAEAVVVFGPQGEHLLTFGRRGRGPGEMGLPVGITLDPEGVLWVLNVGNARYSGFDPMTGVLIREGRRQLFGVPPLPWTGRVDRAGRLLDFSIDRERHPIAVVLDTSFVPRDTLPLPTLPEQYVAEFRSTRTGDRAFPRTVPFAPEPHWAAHPDGGMVVGDGDAYRLHRVDATGDTTMTIEVLRAPVPVTRRERDSVMATPGEASWVGSPHVPSHKPAHGPIFVDDRGRIWVQPAKHAMTWDVLSGEGELLGQVDVPLPFAGSPSVRGERMALSTIGSEGVHIAVVYDLVCQGLRDETRQ